jgi:pimeloyl-ACP methyl ester carboxylesterase
MPVLLIWGARDPLVPLRYAEAMLQEMPHAHIAVVPRAGHVPQWENPDYFNKALLTFLREVREAAGIRGFSWGVSGAVEGLVYREAGERREIVLIHGLGMSSAYFGPFAHALFQRGFHVIAPDLPGFGESANMTSADAAEYARILGRWADKLSMRNAVWIGHSIGCDVVARISAIRPDLVRAAVAIGPLWGSRSRLKLTPLLAVDAFREPRKLWPFIVAGYWRAGIARWVGTLHKSRGEAADDLIVIAGARDPLVNRKYVRNVISVPGAHACHFSHPRETAAAVIDAITAVR